MIRLIPLALVALISCATSQDFVKNKLKGTWALTESREHGTPKDFSEKKIKIQFFEDGSLSIQSITPPDTPKTVKGWYNLNLNTTPWQIDFYTEEGTQVSGIFDFPDDQTLHLESGQSSGARPAGFWNRNFAVWLMVRL